MKYVISLLVSMLICSQAFAADWQYKILSSEQKDETLVVTAEFYNDKDSLVKTEKVSVFRPTSDKDVFMALRNVAEVMKNEPAREIAKQEAVTLIRDVVKPAVDKKKDSKLSAVAVEEK